eukprot:13436548-Alexandrium_andersonii.AAC.1
MSLLQAATSGVYPSLLALSGRPKDRPGPRPRRRYGSTYHSRKPRSWSRMQEASNSTPEAL